MSCGNSVMRGLFLYMPSDGMWHSYASSFLNTLFCVCVTKTETKREREEADAHLFLGPVAFADRVQVKIVDLSLRPVGM